jgi:hypothetical protein
VSQSFVEPCPEARRGFDGIDRAKRQDAMTQSRVVAATGCAPGEMSLEAAHFTRRRDQAIAIIAVARKKLGTVHAES